MRQNVIGIIKMDTDSESTGESADEMDSCSLQYQEADSSLLCTAVFIKNVQVTSDDLVLLYVHPDPQPEESRITHSIKSLLVSIGLIFALTSLIVLSL